MEKKIEKVESDERNTAKMFIHLPKKLHHDLKLRCAIQDSTMQQTVRRLIKNYMKDYEPPES